MRLNVLRLPFSPAARDPKGPEQPTHPLQSTETQSLPGPGRERRATVSN